MSASVHPAYAHTLTELKRALDEGVVDATRLAGLLGDLSRGDGQSLPDDPAAADAIRRLAWLLFVRAPQLDGRYLAIGPMNLAFLGSGQRSVGELVDELAKLEGVQDAGADSAPLDALLTTHGPALEALLAEAAHRTDGAQDKIAALNDKYRDQVRAAAAAGRWGEVPLAGPDAPTARGALSQLPADVALTVFDAWLDAERLGGDDKWDEAIARLTDAAKAAPSVFETYSRRARSWFAAGDRLKAGADLEQALALHPKAAAPRAMRAELRAIIRDMQGSMEDWNAAIDAAPDQVEYRIGRGYTRVALGRLVEAIDDFTEAVHLAPEDTTPLYNRADAFIRKGDVHGAIGDYDKVLQLAPDDVQALLNRGTAHLMLKDGDKAEADFSAALERRPTHATAWAKRAAASLTAGRPWSAWLDAWASLALAEPDWPHHDQITALLQQAYMQLDGSSDAHRANPDDTVARVRHLAKKAPGTALVKLADLLGEHLPGEHLTYHLLRGDTYAGFGKWDKAEAAYRDALAVDPEQARALLGLGRALVHLDKPTPALATLDKARSRAFDLDDDGTFELHLARGRALGTLQQLPEAIAAFTEAVAARPHRADVWFYLGVHHDLAGDKAAAIAAYDKSVEHDSGFAPAWFNRACEHASLGHTDRALADLERAAGLDAQWAAAATTDDYFRPLWNDPGFQALVGRFTPAA